MPEDIARLEHIIRQARRDLILGCVAIGVGILFMLVLGLLVQHTAPGSPIGCNPAPPPGWSHYPDWLRSWLEQYCGS